MVNKMPPDSDRSADATFAASLAQALDKSLDDVDDLSLQRLKNVRAQALSQPVNASRKWISLSVAASVAALLLIPIVIHQSSSNSSSDQELEVVSQEVPYSVEEMDDIEMLMSLEETDA